MRETFRGYYRPTDEEFTNLWKNCIFCLDANILLNIYRYTPETREKFMQILKEVSNRIIIPHQAAEEYQNNRLTVIKEQEDAYDKIINKLQTNFAQIEKSLNAFKKHPLINVKNIVNDLDSAYNSIQSDLKEKQKNHPNLFDKDDLRDEITDLLEGKISNPCPHNKMNEVKGQVEYRYKNKIPPGYKDYTKEENNWGDLILWFQILKIAKEKKLPIIFVTDDKKDDWWWIFKGKTIGPRQELIEEMYKNANVQFYMYKTDQFIEFAEKELFEQNADPKFIKEVQDVLFEDKNLNGNDKLDIVKMLPRKSDYISYSPFEFKPYEMKKIIDKLTDIENGKPITSWDFKKIEDELKSVNLEFELYEKRMQKNHNILEDQQLDKYYNLELVKEMLRENDLSNDEIDYYTNKKIILQNNVESLEKELEDSQEMIYKSKKSLNGLNDFLYDIKRKYKLV